VDLLSVREYAQFASDYPELECGLLSSYKRPFPGAPSDIFQNTNATIPMSFTRKKLTALTTKEISGWVT